MKKVFTLVGLLVMLAAFLPAQQRVPAYQGVIIREQPDGYKLQTYLRGDERSHYAMTLDGWQIKENSKGEWCYALQKKDGSIVAGKKVARNEQDRKKCETKWLQKKGIKKQQ